MKQNYARVACALFALVVGCSIASNDGAPADNVNVTSSPPARTSAASAHVHVVGKGGAKRAQGAGGPNIDWNVTTTAPVITAPAVTGLDFNVGQSSDVFAFGVGNTGTARGITASSDLHAGWAAAARDAGIFVLTNLYDASLKPDLLTYALDNQTSERFTSGGMVFNIAGTKLYALSQTGKLFCFAVPAGGPVGGAATRASACAGWSDYSAGTTVSYSTAWPVYDGLGAVTTIYFGDDSGKLHKVNGSTGASSWSGGGGTIASTSASALASPVVVTDTATLKDVVYVGDTKGRFFRYIDTGTTPTAGSASSYDLCGGGPGSCSSNPWGVYTSPSIDLTYSKAYVASGGSIFEFPVSSTATWTPSQPAKVLIASPTTAIMSSPILDPDMSWVYVGHNNRLFKVQYPFDGSTASNIYSTTLEKSGPDASYPRSTALPYSGTVWIGSGNGTNGNGLVEQFGCGGSGDSSSPARTGNSTLSYGAYVNSPMVMDFVTGNINFGFQNSAGTAGGAVQYKAATGGADWVCPAGQASIAGVACGSSGCAPGCAVVGDCSSNNKATTTCTGGVCGGACSTGYADCNADLKSDGCETDITTTTNCRACGNACGVGITCGASGCNPPYATCEDIHTAFPALPSGQYTINPGTGAFTVYCDMATDGGGWTIIGSFTGAAGEQMLTSDTETTGNPLAFAHSNLNRAKKMAIAAASTETLFLRSSGVFIKANAALFDSNLNAANSHVHFPVTLTTSNATTASGYMGYSNFGTSGGGDFGISQTDGATCSGTTVQGFDHHNTTNYNHLNCGCQRHYLYSYGAGASYDVNTALGDWTATNSCDISAGGALTFYVALRGKCTTAADCSTNHKATTTCTSGVCGGTCSAGYGNCNGSMQGDGCETDLQDGDPNNCGGCGTTCATGEVCVAQVGGSVCQATCPMGQSKCGASCVDLQTDAANCGACGNICGAGTSCSAGVCSDPLPTCQEIHNSFPALGNGVYEIDPDGTGGDAKFSVYCDMTTDGGGWTILASVSGAAGEQELTSNTETFGNPLSFQPSNLSRAKKIAISSGANETIFVRSGGTFIKANAALFDSNLTNASSHVHQSVTLTTSNGTTASGFMGYSRTGITGGGDFGITQTDGATCAGTTSQGFDHHNTGSYNHLNCGCQRHYLYSYGAGASYDVNTALGDWAATNSCDSAAGGALAFYVAVRGKCTTAADCSTNNKATTTCTSGVCGGTCTAGYGDCNSNLRSDGCETNLSNGDPANCGGCGTTCGMGMVCVAQVGGSVCAAGCGGGLTDCGGTCVDTTSNSSHCGACNAPCTAGTFCSASTCSNPLASCKALHTAYPALPSGQYTIDPDGVGGAASFTAYCDMTTDGGGWTIVGSFTGSSGEQMLTSDTEVSGNALSFAHSNISRAKKMALAAAATESLFYRSGGSWMKVNAAMFDASLNTTNTHVHSSVTVTASNGTSAAAFMGYSNFGNTSGGDFGITQNPDGTTGGGFSTTNGFDHHNTGSWNHLNWGCARHYLYSYGAGASYDVNTALGAWTATNTCDGAAGGALTFYAALR